MAFATHEPDSRTFYDWHCALGHVGEPWTCAILKGLGVNVPVSQEESARVRDCLDFCKGKLHKRTFGSRAIYRSSMPFRDVNLDVGSVFLKSKRVHSDFVSFINEFSKYTVFYDMKLKSEFHIYFKRFVNILNSKFRHEVLPLHSNDRGEYRNGGWTS